MKTLLFGAASTDTSFSEPRTIEVESFVELLLIITVWVMIVIFGPTANERFNEQTGKLT